MSDVEQIVQDLAVLSALKKIIAEAETAAKTDLQKHLARGTVYAYAGDTPTDDEQLGYATVPKPSQPKPVVDIEDEARVLPWAVDDFGDEVATFRLTEQGRKSVIARVLKLHEQAGSPAEFEFEGVVVRVPEVRPSAPRFTPSKNVVELVEGMVRAGRLSIADVLELEAGE